MGSYQGCPLLFKQVHKTKSIVFKKIKQKIQNLLAQQPLNNLAILASHSCTAFSMLSKALQYK
jgi:hypothetical protein